jgi:Family of unknown function (DUF5317)
VIVPVAVFIIVLAVPLLGGKLGRLADIKLRAVWTAVGALVIQVGILNVLPQGLSHGVLAAVHLGTYVLAAWFVIANREIPGLPLIALGAALNLAVIAANNGVMPSSPAAARLAGHDKISAKFVNSAQTPNAHLAILGDNFAVPAGYPLANVFSIGDIVLVAGAAVTFHVAAQSRLGRKRDVHFRTISIDPL